ncbi:MAG: DUF805 domain-containing protein [Actinomycetia bacterium]|nr:DUF805 domain-containing protein [Actinomycetes bacterium]
MVDVREGIHVLHVGVGRVVDLSGRESLAEFRKFAVSLIVAHLLLAVAGRSVMFEAVRALADTGAASDWAYGSGFALFVVFYMLVGASGVRRLHDIGQKGVWMSTPVPFLIFGFGVQINAGADSSTGGPLGISSAEAVEAVCGVGASLAALYLLWRLTRPGQVGSNKYGAAPLD